MSSLNQAKQFASKGDYESAIKVLEESDDVSRYRYYELSKYYLEIEKFKESLDSIDSVISMKFDWSGAHAIRGFLYLKLGDISSSLKSFMDAADVWPASDLVGLNSFFSGVFNKIHIELNKSPDQYRCISGMLSGYLKWKFPSQPIGFFQAALAAWSFDIKSARMDLMLLDVETVKLIDRHAGGILSISDGVINTDVSRKSGTEIPDFNGDFSHVFLTTCDSNYFLKFYETFVSSFLSNSLGGRLAIGVVNATHEVKGIAEKIGRAYGDKVSVFFVNVELTKDKKIFYACSRFLLSEEMLIKYNRPLIIVDIDALFVGDIDGYELKGLLEHDFSVKEGLQTEFSHYPWRNYAAGFTFFSGSLASRKVASFLSGYINYYLELYSYDDCLWYLDQSAIAVAFRKLNDFDIGLMKYRSSKVIIFPDASVGTKEDFVDKHNVSPLVYSQKKDLLC